MLSGCSAIHLLEPLMNEIESFDLWVYLVMIAGYFARHVNFIGAERHRK